MRNVTHLRLLKAFWLSLACVAFWPAMAWADAALDQEIKYIDALAERGYVDFTKDVIDAAKVKWPAASGVIEAATIRAELNGGKQEDVAKKIAARPDQNSIDTWLLKLELAQSYFRYQKYQDADKLYSEFFKKFAKVSPEIKSAYVKAAYSYIQMLSKIDRLNDSLPYYQLAIDNCDDERQVRNLQAEYLSAMLLQADNMQPGDARNKVVGQAEALARKMVWKQDAFFGDAINGMAHAKMLRGDVKGAQEMIKEYLPDLMRIHEAFKETDPDGSLGVLRMSPLPACRYLIAKMLMDETEKEIAKGSGANDEVIKNLLLGERDPATKKRNGQGAFNHVVNVFAGYPECQYASAAGDMAEKIQAIVQQRYGATLKANVSPEQRAKVRAQQYVGANVKFDGGDYAGAAEAFGKVISQYGIDDQAVPAMRKMVESYVRVGSKGGKMDPVMQLYADTVTAALAEGCSGVKSLQKDAGNALRQIANFYSEIKLMKPEKETLDLFFEFYPKHPDATTLQLKIAKDNAATDPDRAEKLYKQVIEAATGPAQRQTREGALFLLLQFYQPGGGKADPALELATAKTLDAHYDGIERPGSMAAMAQFFLADANRHQADALRRDDKDGSQDKEITAAYARAAKAYAELATVLAKPNNKYQTTAAEAKQNAQLLENSLYLQGVCMQQMPATGNAKRDKAIKGMATKYFNAYLAKYPKGKRAPAAMLQIGTLEAAEGNIEASQATLDKLAKTFPESEEARNSIPILADSLFKMGMKTEGLNTYKRMFDSKDGTYTPGQYADAAKKLYESGEYKLAIEACDAIQKSKGAAAYIARAMLLRAQALAGDKQITEAYKQVKEVLEKYGRSEIAIDANMELIKIAGLEIEEETTKEGRNDLIGRAKTAMKFITAHRADDPAVSAELNLALAEVAAKRYYGEAKQKDEHAPEALGAAINAYDVATSVGTLDPNDPRVTKYVQSAYMGRVNLLKDFAEATTDKVAKKETYQDLVNTGNIYLENFPDGKYVNEITTAISLAKIGIGE